MGKLEVLTIEKPCTSSWSAMTGDDRVRHCLECHLDVYDLSAMSRDEAERVIAQHEGRVCVRFVKREDGTVLTQDCEPFRAEPRACTERPSTVEARPAPAAPLPPRSAAASRPAPPAASRPAPAAAAPPPLVPPEPAVRPRVVMMGMPPSPPPRSAVLEKPQQLPNSGTLLADVSRALRASLDLDAAEEKLVTVERALLATGDGRPAACPACLGPLFIPTDPAVAAATPEQIRLLLDLATAIAPAVEAAFDGDRAKLLLRELRRIHLNGSPGYRRSCPHCHDSVGIPL